MAEREDFALQGFMRFAGPLFFASLIVDLIPETVPPVVRIGPLPGWVLVVRGHFDKATTMLRTSAAAT
jgi:hypothetical protein